MEQFRKVLLYLNPAEQAGAALERAIELCKRSGAKLTLLAVVPELSVYLRYPQGAYPSLVDTLTKEARDRLAGAAASARKRGLDAATEVREGKPFLEISREALRGRFDLVMLTAEDSTGIGRSTSTAMQLFRVSPCPVWAVRPQHGGRYAHVLAAVDPSAPESSEKGLNEQILDLAISIGELEGSKVETLHAWESAGAGDELRAQVNRLANDAMQRLLAPYASSIPAGGVHLVEGDAASAIADFVANNEVDLLVMGTVVRTGIAGLLIGNTAEKTLSKVDCSVLALKPPSFVSPVEQQAEQG